MSFAPANTASTYLPVEFQIPEDDLFYEFISKRERLTASILNLKENANYQKIELLSAEQWFNPVSSTSLIARYGFRVTADLVQLNGGVIGAGVTNIVLTTSTQPAAINGMTDFLEGYGGATSASGVKISLPDPQVFVRFTPSTQTITITNNFGSNLTQCYYVFEYLKQ